MDNFIHRTISVEDGDMTVSRTRTSQGFSSIKITVVGQSPIEFNSKGSDLYEQRMGRLAEMINEVCSNGCTLPTLP